MKEYLNNVWRVIKAFGLVVTLIVTPATKVIRKTLLGEKISIFEMAFALWRLVVWVSFSLCVTSVAGIPPLVVYMVLTDMMLISTQALFSAVK